MPRCGFNVSESTDRCPSCGSARGSTPSLWVRLEAYIARRFLLPWEVALTRRVNSPAFPRKLLVFVAAMAVVVGFGDLAFGYYMVLRLFLCGVSLFFLFGAKLSLNDGQRWILGALAVLYNPVLPVQIGEKSIWEALNVGTVIFLWFVSVRNET